MISNLAAAATLVWSDDFENGLDVHSYHGGNFLNVQVTSSPVSGDGHNQVLEYSDKANTASWGSELRATGHVSGSILLSDYSATPGMDTFTFTFDYFIPENTVSEGNDDLGVMIRFTSGTVNGGNSTNKTQFLNVDNIERGKWLHFEFTSSIPALDGQTNLPVAYIVPFIIWNDKGTMNQEGVLGYVDNVNFYLTPEPGKSVLAMVGMAAFLMRRQRRFSRSSRVF